MRDRAVRFRTVLAEATARATAKATAEPGQLPEDLLRHAWEIGRWAYNHPYESDGSTAGSGGHPRRLCDCAYCIAPMR